MSRFPNDRPMSDAEIAVAVTQALLDDRQNPRQNLPFQPHVLGLLARLGIGDGSNEERAWREKFVEVNREPDLEFRLAEYCWRLVGLGYLLPKVAGTSWGAFYVTSRGRAFLQGIDAAALSSGGLDGKLGGLGYATTEPPRQYARLAHGCFLAGHYESSIVMLGVANEALILDLADGLSMVQNAVLPNLRANPKGSIRPTIEWLTEAFGTHRRELRASLRSNGNDDGWVEYLHDTLHGTSQAIRLTRNEHGHPTGVTASQEDVLQLLVLFPRFAELCKNATDSLAGVV